MSDGALISWAIERIKKLEFTCKTHSEYHEELKKRVKKLEEEN